MHLLQGYIVIAQGPDIDWGHGTYRVYKQNTLETLFLRDNVVVPILWDQNFAPDLPASVMKPSCLAKGGGHRTSMKIIQFWV